MPANLDVDLLKTFIAIAEHGSYTKAAEQVHKTQSAISMQMKRLEEIVSRPVFQKQGRSNTLTTDGQRLLDYAYRITKLNDEAVSTFRQPELTGLVRLGTPEDYADRLLPEILARFARSHPLVQVDVECLGSAALATAVKKKDLDLSIVTNGKDVECDTIIRREDLVWVTALRHCAHEQEVLPLALSHITCSWRHMAIDALEAINRPYRIAYASSNSNAIAATVLAGTAIAAIPKFTIRPGMRVLGEADNFPPLGDFEIGLIHAAAPGNNVIDALACHITESFCNLHSAMIAAE